MHAELTGNVQADEVVVRREVEPPYSSCFFLYFDIALYKLCVVETGDHFDVVERIASR